MPIMNYSQKKEALKKLLISANLRNSSVSKKGNIKPLASSLLQALKEKRPTMNQTNRSQKFSQHLQLQESRKDPPNKIIQYEETKPEKKPLFKKPPVTGKIFHDHKPKPTNKPRRVPQRFSPPSNLDSGFTPFFKSSKYFDEDAYFENLTTTEQIETIEETTTITEAPPPQTPEFYQPQRNYGEKYSMQQKQFIKPYYTTLKPKQYSSKPGRYNYSGKQLTTVPSYDGFKDNWDSLDQDFLNFNSQKQISRPLKTKLKTKAKPYFDEWDRKQDHLYKARDQDYYKPLVVADEKRYPEEEATYTRGFMDSQPFSLPLSFESSFKTKTRPQKINVNMWDRNYIQSQTNMKESYPRDSFTDSRSRKNQNVTPDNKYERSYVESGNQRRNSLDRQRSGEPKTIEIEYRGNSENSFGDDFSFSDSNLGEFFDDISDTFPEMSDFGPSWESLKF